MALNQNQFSISPVQGMMDLTPAKVVSALVGSGSAGSLVAGQAVKIVDTAGKIPVVVECAADSDLVFGFITYNVKNSTYSGGDVCEISTGFDDVMYMTAGAAFAPLTQLMVVIASKKMIAATSGKPISAYALDKATADGDIVRCVVTCPAFFVKT